MPEGTAWDNPPIGEDLADQPVPTKKRWGWRKAKAPAAPLAATAAMAATAATAATAAHGGHGGQGGDAHGFCVCGRPGRCAPGGTHDRATAAADDHPTGCQWPTRGHRATPGRGTGRPHRTDHTGHLGHQWRISVPNRGHH